MTARRSPRTASASRKLTEMAIAAPQVVAHRLTRMAMAGPVLSSRDRKEFTEMVQEKPMAFARGWTSAWWEMLRVQQQMAWSMTRAFWTLQSPLLQAQSSSRAMTAGLSRVGDKFISPVHGKAVANARRLARTRLR
jgi:hypothetical protein